MLLFIKIYYSYSENFFVDKGEKANSINIMLEKEKKQELIIKFRIHPKDTGSPEVQVALLSERLNILSEHLKTHKKDNHSRRRLIMMVSKRKILLEYLAREDVARWKNLTGTLQLRAG